jgi:hypothetical protein
VVEGASSSVTELLSLMKTPSDMSKNDALAIMATG